MRRLSSWLPPFAWMAVILWVSGDSWSAAETGSLLGPLLARLLPWATPAQVAALHAAIRKAAHLVEYGVLALLWHRALVRERGASRAAAWSALGVAIAWAVLDEALQSTQSRRSGSVVDVGLDATGAIAALALVRGDWRRLVDRTTATLLWMTAVGGALALIVNWLAGVQSIALWIATPAAVLLLALRARK